MKTTYREILEAKQGLRKLLDQQLPAAQAIALARLVQKLNAELALFSEQQQRLPADEQQRRQKIEELLAVEVEIDSDRVTLTLREIDAGTVLATGAFVDIEEATE